MSEERKKTPLDRPEGTEEQFNFLRTVQLGAKGVSWQLSGDDVREALRDSWELDHYDYDKAARLLSELLEEKKAK